MIIIIFILIIFVLFLLYKNLIEEKEKIIINNYDASYPIRPYIWYEWEYWYPYRTNYYYSTYRYRNRDRNHKLRPVRGPNGPIRHKKSIALYSTSAKINKSTYFNSNSNLVKKVVPRKNNIIKKKK